VDSLHIMLFLASYFKAAGTSHLGGEDTNVQICSDDNSSVTDSFSGMGL